MSAEQAVMTDSEKLAVAAHLHVAMRRKMGRVTDVEWLVRNAEYAREIIGLACGQTEHADVVDWGTRLRAALFPPRPAPSAPVPVSAAPSPSMRYVGRLR